MVSTSSIVSMIFSLVLSVGIPLVGIIYLKKKYKASLKVFLIGMAAFFISTQILEAPVHVFFLSINKTTSEFLLNTPWAYMLYGGLMAGIFEETARFIAFKYALKDKMELTDGVTFGLGHGGMEAILIGGITTISAITNSVLINSGQFVSKLQQSGVAQDVIDKTLNTYLNSAPSYWAVIGVERAIAMCIHIALSIIVLYAVKERKNIYYVLAILIHAVINFAPALYQAGVIQNIFIIEGIIAIEAIAVLIFAVKIFKKKSVR